MLSSTGLDLAPLIVHRHPNHLADRAIGVFIRGDGYGGAGKGERGASDPA